MNPKKKIPQSKQTDHDTYWKKIITDLFPDFVAFFYPKLVNEIDWSRPYEFLEQELHNIISEKYKDTKSTDKLVKVYLKNGKTTWILIHIEVQSFFEKDFAKRMFDYWVLLYTRYSIEQITAIAIFTNDTVPRKYQKFETDCFGTELSYRYNTYKIREQQETALLMIDNPFAIAVLAALYALKSKKEVGLRYKFKTKLIKLALTRGWNREKIAGLLIFIKGIVRLPKPLEQKIELELQNSFIMQQPVTESWLDIMSDDDRIFWTTLFKDLWEQKAKEESIRMANELASEMANELASEMANELASEMANELASEMANELAAEKIQKVEKEYEKKVEKQVLNLYDKLGLNGNQIANTLEVEEKWVNEVIEKHRLID